MTKADSLFYLVVPCQAKANSESKDTPADLPSASSNTGAVIHQGDDTKKRCHDKVEGSKVTVNNHTIQCALCPELTIICFTIILHEEGGNRGQQEGKPTQNQSYLYLLAKLVNNFSFCCTPIIRQRQQRIRYSSSMTFFFGTFYEPESNDMFCFLLSLQKKETSEKTVRVTRVLRLDSHLAILLLWLRICDLYCFFLLEQDALKQKGACEEVDI